MEFGSPIRTKLLFPLRFIPRLLLPEWVPSIIMIVSPLVAIKSNAELRWFKGVFTLPKSELSTVEEEPPLEATYHFGPEYSAVTITALDDALSILVLVFLAVTEKE